MSESGVYRILNLNNGKTYIGSSKDLRGRRLAHFNELKKNKHANPRLQNAWNKHSPSAFLFEAVLYCNDELLITYEQQFLDFYKPEYNMSMIAGRIEHTAEVRAKMSAAKIGKPSPRKGATLSAETRAKISTASIGKISPKKGIPSNVPAWNKGVPHTERTKQILAIKCSGWNHSSSAIEKIRVAGKGRIPWNKGKHLTAETCAKLSAIRKGKPRSAKHCRAQSGLNHWRVQHKAAHYHGA